LPWSRNGANSSAFRIFFALCKTSGRPYGWLIGSAAGVHDDFFVDADALERMLDLAARSSVARPSATR